MITVLGCMLSALAAFVKPRCDLAAQILTLWHQLAVLQRERKTPRLNRWDRILWVCLSKVWPSWTTILVIVQPDTVICWYRSAFRIFWRWKSNREGPGRPKIDAEVRALIRRMARENIWRAPRIHKELVCLGYELSQRTVAARTRSSKSTGAVAVRALCQPLVKACSRSSYWCSSATSRHVHGSR